MARIALPLLAAHCACGAAGRVYEMRDVRQCRGHEKAFAKCDGLPSCTQACEPVDCLFNAWDDWYDAGGCSGLCFRHRAVQTSSNECGTPCAGPQIESKGCPKDECLLESRDCLLSTWSDWSACNSAVDQRYRYREVQEPPAGTGLSCAGSLNETRPCDARRPVDCELSGWGQWTACSATCDGGYRAAVRKVLRHAEHGGRPCEGTLRKTETCNEQLCAGKRRDCQVGEWSSWQGCDFASPQQRYRTREVVSPAVGGGKACGEVVKQTRGCPQGTPQDCVFSDWSAWGQCDKTCGGGQMYRKRALMSHPEHGGNCTQLNSLTEIAPCGTEPCAALKACSLSLWSEWLPCSASCDMGLHQRSREMFFGEEAVHRRLSLFGLMADKVVKAQEGLPVMEDCSAGFSGGLREVAPCVVEACPRQDCAWGLWSEWSACTCSCGGGAKRRSRSVRTPPGRGGQPCEPGDGSEVEACNTQPCETCVDGAWGDWSDWSACSATCGGGFKSRRRDVSQHPNHCGVPVAGVEDDFASCDAAVACEPDIDCELSEWTAWTQCSDVCYGVTERHRRVATFPSGRGKACSMEPLKEVEMCNPRPGAPAPEGCAGSESPSPCQLSAWSDWGACSASCDGGQTLRLRHVLSPASQDGRLCSDTLSETRACGTLACQRADCLDCAYGDWGDWGECSKCGGQRYRHRNIVQTPSHCGKPCDVQAAKQTGKCTSECEEEHWCAWSPWSEYGQCSSECGPATKSRQRVLAVFKERPEEPLFSGSPGMTCEGMQLDSTACEFRSCTAECEPRDCEMGEWSEWSSPSCSQLCERTRIVKAEGACGGRACDAALTETKRCEHDCQEVQDCQLSSWQAWSECAFPQGQKYRKRTIVQDAKNGGAPCEGGLSETQSCSKPSLPVPCELGGWSEWSECTRSCLGGLKRRVRAVRSPAASGGLPCEGGLEELAVCSPGRCAAESTDCAVGAWGAWSECGHNGQRSRARAVEEPRNGGRPCEAALQEIQECSQATDCHLSDWSDWDGCDKTCAGGQQQRHRQVVTNPRLGGRACAPSLMETRGCNEEPCHKKDCIVSDWGSWGACSATCGPGQRSRQRSLVQEPQDGGLGCGLELSQLAACSAGPCEYVDCLWSDWADWSDCSALCDGGQRTRSRAIARPSQRGGKPCVPLSKEEVGACNEHKCGDQTCVDGAWGDWEEWEKCSSTCQGGVTWRARTVAAEANHCGKPAAGPARVYASCNTNVSCVESVDCQFADWGAWSDCTSACDGVKRRSRGIAVHGKGEGAFCLGPLKETAPCNPGPGERPPEACSSAPAEDCQVSEWAAWGECSASCGGGSQTREREVLAPPANGGARCEEVLAEARGCGRAPCSQGCEPRDCAWDDWGEWSACDKCGGQRKRFRHVLREAACGGAACEARASEETASCARQCHAPVYCMWGDWKEWSACSATCGHAEKSRTRHLTVTADPPLSLLEDYDASQGLDEGLLLDRVRGLEHRTRDLRTRRLQRLSLAFAGGGLSLVAGLAALRALQRRVARASAGGARGFSRLPCQDARGGQE